jgi:hypothetical protein
MEFLDFNLTKDSSLFLSAIHRDILLADFKENYTVLFSGFTNPYKKIRVTKKLESIHE